MKKFSKTQLIYLILALSFLVKFIAVFFYADKELVNEWGFIFHNYKASGVIGYYVALDEFNAIPKFAEIGEKVLPSVFMPPLYFFFIYIINFFIPVSFGIVNSLIFIQILISIGSIYIFYKITEELEKNNFQILVTFLFAFFPLNIYACLQVSSITLQIFLMLHYFLLIILYLKRNKIKYLIFFSIISGFLILIRGEFFLFYIFTLFFFFLIKSRNFKSCLISIIITLIVISPYLYRNYEVFNSVTITKSFGYNLLKGNNPTFTIEGNPKFIEKYNVKNYKIKTENNFEIILDNKYKNEAIKIIKSDPFEYFKFYLLKILSFMFFDMTSSYPHYYNFFHIFPKIIVSITGFFGALLAFRRADFFQYLSLFYFLNIFLFSIFFILPRYSLMLLPINLILTIFVIQKLRGKFLNKFR
tara:strand:+ start:2758 stop:4002 length:1245 start_codon:yes stop_codon:yes gene_type:complete